MKKKLGLLLLLSLGSCASLTENLPGYTTNQINAKKNLHGMDRDQLIAELGRPVAEGQCYGGGKIGVGQAAYKMIYLKKPTPKYLYAMEIADKKASINCTMMTLRKNKEGKYVYSSYMTMGQTLCNKSYGAIHSTLDRKKCERIYKN